MLDHERELILDVATEVEVGVAPRMQFGASAERLPSTDMGSAFACMMHKDHGDLVAALKAAQEVEQRRDLGGRVRRLRL